jgi:hypothetical protein
MYVQELTCVDLGLVGLVYQTNDMCCRDATKVWYTMRVSKVLL